MGKDRTVVCNPSRGDENGTTAQCAVYPSSNVASMQELNRGSELFRRMAVTSDTYHLFSAQHQPKSSRLEVESMQGGVYQQIGVTLDAQRGECLVGESAGERLHPLVETALNNMVAECKALLKQLEGTSLARPLSLPSL